MLTPDDFAAFSRLRKPTKQKGQTTSLIILTVTAALEVRALALMVILLESNDRKRRKRGRCLAASMFMISPSQ